MKIIAYDPDKAAEIADLFLAAVHGIDPSVYSEAQKEAWAPTPPNYAFWAERLAEKRPFLAMIEDRVAGFVELEADGHIDCLYSHPDFQNRGVASALYGHLLAAAECRGLSRLYVEASLVAKPFFEKRGFVTKAENHLERHGITLINFSMEKSLA